MRHQLSFLVHKSKRAILNDFARLHDAGWDIADIRGLLHLAHKQNQKAADILSLQNNLIKLSKKNTKIDIKAPSPSLPANAKPALDGLDDLLAPHLNFRHGYFIEAGANDGYTFSNTYYLENTLGWEGLLVEGIPSLADRCRTNRVRSTVVNCALVADEAATPSVIMHYADLMSVVDRGEQHRAEVEEHVRQGLQVQKIADSYRVEVAGRTLSSLLDEHAQGRSVDFLSLDVEGGEMEVLRGIDFLRHAPRFMLVETHQLDEVIKILGERYEMIAKLSVHDYLFRCREPAKMDAK